MIKNILIKNQNDLFNWKLNLKKIEEKYPHIFEEYKNCLSDMGYPEIIDILPKEDDIDEIIFKSEAVIILLSDGTNYKIFNTELLKLFGSNYCEGWSILHDKQFVYFIITKAYFQSGGLAIWDIMSKAWIFNHADEDFCVEAIVYSGKIKAFIGISVWNYPIINDFGEYFFMIKPEWELIKVDLKEIISCDLDYNKQGLCQSFINFNNNSLCYDEDRSLIIKRDEKGLSFFYLNFKI